MNYSIKPGENEFQKARETVGNQLKALENAIDVEDIEIVIGWQDFERPTNFQTTDSSLVLMLNSNYEWEGEVRRSLVHGLLELEFMEKSEYDDIDFHWQDIAMMSYVKARGSEFLQEEYTEVKVDEKVSRILEELSKEDEEFSEILYKNAGNIATVIGRKVVETDRVDEIPSMKKKDIEKLIKEVL